MDKSELIRQKQDLIAIYNTSLHLLELRQARNGGAVDVRLSNQIENMNFLISQLKQEMEDLIRQATVDAPYRLWTAAHHLQKYDYFVTRFADEMRDWDGQAGDFVNTVLLSLKKASLAEHVFWARFVDDQWQIRLDDEAISGEFTQMVNQNHAYRELLLKACSRPDISLAVLGENVQSCVVFPFPDSPTFQALVFLNLSFETGIDTTFGVILRAIVQSTEGLTRSQKPEAIEFAIYNGLKRSFGLVSNWMYGRQFHLFNQRLENMTIYFEPIIYLDPIAPSLFGWEALARDETTGRSPGDLFAAAELWGRNFLLQVDLHFLQVAINNCPLDYQDPKTPRPMRKNLILPLSVNVYPQSLLHPKYFEALKRLQVQGHMPLNKLYLEISEKFPTPQVDKTYKNQNETEAFRQQLLKYNQLGVRFSIDDFGIGYSSSSRLSRLGPALVKVDRDALLDLYGNFTVEYIVKLALMMPGDVGVIIEGYDEESRFSLQRLYEVGVRYVQSFYFGKAKPRWEITDRLERAVHEEIVNALKGCI